MIMERIVYSHKNQKENLEKMNNPEELIKSLSKLHTTKMGQERIKRNLNLSECDVVKYCRQIITSKDCNITKQGKNWYCRKDGIVITVNSYSITIITAHIEKK